MHGLFKWFQYTFLFMLFSDRDETYYLTWKNMSTQSGILGVISSQKLCTAPSKEQYLPAYFKQICDEYLSSDEKHRVFPVEVSDFFINYFKFIVRLHNT